MHVVSGDQAQNMHPMGRMGRGAGPPATPVRGERLAARARRSLALREAVRNGWDADAVAKVVRYLPRWVRRSESQIHMVLPSNRIQPR